MRIWKWIEAIMVIFGVLCLVYFSFVFIHEYGHYWSFQEEGIEVEQVCLLGWKLDNPNRILNAWVLVYEEPNSTFHDKWDFKESD